MLVSEVGFTSCGSETEACLTAAEEKGIIRNLTETVEKHLREGDIFFLISSRWWNTWVQYVKEDSLTASRCANPLAGYTANPASTRPPTIDNSDIVTEVPSRSKELHVELREELVEGIDYVLLPERIWKAFHDWYGGGPVLSRKVIAMGSQQHTELNIEVYPLRLHLISMPEGKQRTLEVSKKDTVGVLYSKVSEVIGSTIDQVKVWNYSGQKKHKLLSDPEETLEDAALLMDQEILSEVQVNGTWPEDSMPYENGCSSSGRELALVPAANSDSFFSIAGGPSGSTSATGNFNDMRGSYSPLSLAKDHGLFGSTSNGTSAGPKGLTGLQNLGNTCFMNSALQCLVHTPQLAEFFLQDYNKEINRDNPLGMEGELAIAFGELLRKLWAPGRTPVAPRAFKTKLARFAPQFSGYNQHDSQELLAFLLDGLHEDLNRVKTKPYIEVKDADGRPDEEVADEYWANHRARNDSIIVDVYQGQYKSTLVCPECNKVSVTFDPFMYLSLPLPAKTTRAMTVTVFSGDGSFPPTAYTVTVPRHGRIKDLVQALSNSCRLENDERLLIVELYNNRIFRVMDDPNGGLSGIQDEDKLAAYRLPRAPDHLLVVMHVRLQEVPYGLDHTLHRTLFGAPFIACLSEETASNGLELQTVVKKLLKPLILEQADACEVQAQSSDNGDGEQRGDVEMLEGETSTTNSRMISDKCEKVANNGNDRDVGYPYKIIPGQNPSLRLWNTDEKGTLKDLIVLDNQMPSVFSPTRNNVKFRYVALEWSEGAMEQQYDMHALDSVPEVCEADLPLTSKKARQEIISLYTCLEAFLKEEPLGPEDMWYCPRCKEHRQASKKLDLWRLPEILVVHLKRFSYSRFAKNKLQTFVNFPIHDLDLTKYVARTTGPEFHLYELYAVSNHYGSMGGGHYTAYAKLLDDNKWYRFDDSNVSGVSEEEIKTTAAYVLFYRRKKEGRTLHNVERVHLSSKSFCAQCFQTCYTRSFPDFSV
ncbi:hypothetical protein O6H91_21G023400 [Diphasiastrum complanatum]|uniref:Uncharacterized protein n=1 Tax=Diphasiastrum complanatum TaxID=34168 RepID=A0ACC2AIL8_DIPCM|nr:hypothetical protein O6H91_21G023400 [Diphasiastrum complanatum]